MTSLIKTLLLAGACALLSTSINAQTSVEPTLQGDFAGCITSNWGVQGASRDCLNQSLEKCLLFPENEPAGYGCLLDAKDEFTTMIAKRLVFVQNSGNERIGAIAAIETKYDRLSQQLNCERARELNFLAGAPKNVVEYSYALCDTFAEAQTFIQLFAKSGGLNEG